MLRQYELVERVKNYDPDADEALINRAYVFSMQAHGSQKRASGDPYFSHPIEVAGILTDLHLDDETIVAAILTVMSYSMIDTIVVFDRIRENLKLVRRESLSNIINLSVNQTLSRTILTSGLTFLTALSLFLFGGQVLNSFSFALVVGIIVGTYSSIFIASPILVFWQNFLDSRASKTPPAPPVKEVPQRAPGTRKAVRG